MKISTAIFLAGVHMLYPLLAMPIFLLLGRSGPLHAILLVLAFEAGRCLLLIPFFWTKND